MHPGNYNIWTAPFLTGQGFRTCLNLFTPKYKNRIENNFNILASDLLRKLNQFYRYLGTVVSHATSSTFLEQPNRMFSSV